jgi:hypothetical protein
MFNAGGKQPRQISHTPPQFLAHLLSARMDVLDPRRLALARKAGRGRPALHHPAIKPADRRTAIPNRSVK